MPVVLGRNRLAACQAVEVPSRIAWFNFPLARELGLEVPTDPKGSSDTPEAIRRALSYRLLEPGEEAGTRPQITVYADRYGGTGTCGNAGAGRSAFLPFGDLYVKGIGRTPLCRPNGRFDHHHGGASLREGLLEAIWGEVGQNLFSVGSTRILALIDPEAYTHYPDGGWERRALIVRTGSHLRPAHLLDSLSNNSQALELFSRTTEALGLHIKSRRPPRLFNAEMTMRGLIERHAGLQAEQFRYRVLHGSLTTSNLSLDGQQIDLGTISSQPRTAPIRLIQKVANDMVFGFEHLARAKELARAYEAVKQAPPLPGGQVARGKFDFFSAMEKSYYLQLVKMMIRGIGIKAEVVEEIHAHLGEVCSEFSEHLFNLACQVNPGDTTIDKKVVRDVAVFDVFNILRELPSGYFANRKAELVDRIKALAEPIWPTDPLDAHSLARYLDEKAKAIAPLYARILDRAGDLAEKYYGDRTTFERSIIQRARFENAPIDSLYRSELNDQLLKAVDDYIATGDPTKLDEPVDEAIEDSFRNADQLIISGQAEIWPDGTIALQRKKRAGLTYTIEAAPSGWSCLSLSTPLTGDSEGYYRLSALPGSTPTLSRSEVSGLQFRGSFDGWQSLAEVPAILVNEVSAAPTLLRFEVPVSPGQLGRFEGALRTSGEREVWLKDHHRNFKSMAFAVPDARELAVLRKHLLPQPVTAISSAENEGYCNSPEAEET